MITVNCPGGWEGDARPGGLFVVPYPTGLVETHLGTISAPDWLRWMRLASDGRVVGNAQKGGQVWEWADGRWHDRGPSFGNRPVIYTPAGDLDIVRGAGTFTGALGWRYVADDGRLIAAWETYDPSTPLGARARRHEPVGMDTARAVRRGPGRGRRHLRARLAERACATSSAPDSRG